MKQVERKRERIKRTKDQRERQNREEKEERQRRSIDLLGMPKQSIDLAYKPVL
jgi:hypothetical protein